MFLKLCSCITFHFGTDRLLETFSIGRQSGRFFLNKGSIMSLREDEFHCSTILYHLIEGNQNVISIIVTEVTFRSPFITYSSHNL